MGTLLDDPKPVSAPPAESAVPASPADSGSGLKKNILGSWEIAFFVIAASAPVFVVVGVAWTAYMLGGIGAPLGYIGGGVVLLGFAAGFTAMSKYVKNAGAFYAYITRGLGKHVGVGAALVALFAYGIESTGFYGAFGFFAETTFEDLLGVNIPWQVWMFIGIVIVGILGYRNVNLGAKIVAAILIAEIVILSALSIAVLIRNPGGMSLEPLNPRNFFVPGIAALLIFGFGAFTGFESTAIYAEEARSPEKTIPRATYGAVIFLALFYGFTVWIASVALGVEGVMTAALSDTGADMYFDMSDEYLGYWAFVVLRIMIVTSIIACTVGFHNAVARYGFSLGREGLLPKYLGRSHRRMGSPHLASLTMTIIAALICLVVVITNADPYLKLFVWTYAPGVTGLVLCQCLCVVAVIAYFWRDRRGHGRFRVFWAPLLGAVGLGASFVLILLNYELISGYTGWVNLAFILPVPIVFAIGVIQAAWIKRHDPGHYGRLAADLEDVNVCARDEIDKCESDV